LCGYENIWHLVKVDLKIFEVEVYAETIPDDTRFSQTFSLQELNLLASLLAVVSSHIIPTFKIVRWGLLAVTIHYWVRFLPPLTVWLRGYLTSRQNKPVKREHFHMAFLPYNHNIQESPLFSVVHVFIVLHRCSWYSEKIDTPGALKNAYYVA